MQGPGTQGDVHQPWLGHSSHGWGGRGAAGLHLQSPQAIWDSSDLPEHFINPILYSMQNVAWGEVIRPGLCSSHPLLFLLQIRLLRGILFFFFLLWSFYQTPKHLEQLMELERIVTLRVEIGSWKRRHPVGLMLESNTWEGLRSKPHPFPHKGKELEKSW